MRFPLLFPAVTLTLALASGVALGQSTPDRFDHDVLPPYRGTASGQYAGWDSFSSAFGAPNAPDDPNSNLTATLEQLAPGALVTSGGNIYSPAGPTSFVVECDLTGDLSEVIVQLRTQGSPLDPNAFGLELDVLGSVIVVPVGGIQDLGPAGGMAAESLVRFDIPSSTGPIDRFRVMFAATAAHMSLDAAMVDARSESNVGSSYCTAIANSTGSIGTLAAFGTLDPSMGPFELRVDSLPPFVFGLYLNSRQPGHVLMPNASAGVLCLGGQIGRLNAQVFNSGATGSHVAPIDLAQLPTPNGFVAATSGDVWHFQCWHRDVHQGSASNFTLPVAVTIP